MIHIKNLTKKYGESVILDEFSYKFKNRGITCLLGASGSGKSTLFNLVAGFDRDYKGEIISGDTDIANLSSEELASYRKTQIGFVFQEYNLIKGYTVLENILLAAELNDSTVEENKTLALNLIERLGMISKADEKIENLSGGQKQRVAIARALVNNPAVILADEPTGALDRNTANEIMEFFSEIAKEKPVIIITHDEKICDFANEVLRIIEGKADVIKSADLLEDTRREVTVSQKTASVSMKKRAFRNFKNHFGKYVGVALAVTIGICAVLLSFSSQNIIEDRIERFKEKNTAFEYGQIQFDESSTAEKAEDILKENQDIEEYYFQYTIPESNISLNGRTVKMAPKEFGSIANEVMNIGVSPKSNEIIITPSVAKQLTDDLKSLIGKSITFTCGSFSKELTVSGIFNGSFDNFYLSSDMEQELYSNLNLQKNAISISYKVKGFDEVLKIERQLNEAGIIPTTASKQVESLKTTFKKLQTLFFVVSIFIIAIALFICVMLLIKITNIRAKEIGILMALGYKSTQIKQMLLLESTLLSALSVIATFVVMAISAALSTAFSMAIIINSTQILLSVFATFIIVSVVSLYSNRKLLKTDPAVVLRK